MRALRPGGRAVVLSASVTERAELGVRSFYFGQYDPIGTVMGSLRDFAKFLSIIDGKRVPPPVIDKSYPLGQADQAHRHLESGAGFDKVVLHLG